MKGTPVPPINWAAQQRVLLQRFGARVAVRDAAGCATYAEVLSAAAGIGARLLRAGVRPGEHVATLFRNGRAAVAAAYATQLAGAAETPLNISYAEAERGAVLALAGCRHVVCAAEHAAFFRTLGLTTHVTEEIPSGTLDDDFPAVAADLPGRLAFTSGTTGLPKAIVYAQSARWRANLLLQASLPWLPSADSRIALMTPFAHGTSLQALAWLDQGGEAVLLDGVDLARLGPMLERGELEALFAAPTVLAKITAGFEGRRFRGVRAVFTGTAPLPPSVYAAARAMFGPVVRITYGKSEVFNPITVLPPGDTDAYFAEGGGADGSCCVGWPAPGVELAIAEDGEILIRAQHMSDGWIDASGFHRWREDGFHATGDVGRIDARGRLHLVARLSDAMKSGGYKIYPQEIEAALAAALPCEVVVLGWPSDYWGEVIVAVAATPPLEWESLARAALDGLAAFKRPRFFLAVDSMPRNGQGKLLRRALFRDLQARWRLIDGPRPSLQPVADTSG